MVRYDPGGSAARLGVGMIYTISADRFARTPGALDYWAITPDMFWTDAGPNLSGNTATLEPRFRDLERWVDALNWASGRLPIVAHHIGLSLASALEPDPAYIEQLSAWNTRWDYPWISDHLSFAQVEGPDQAGSAGIALPAPYDHNVLSLVADRVANVMARTGTPFLLENPARYISYPDEELTEPEFLNCVCQRTGCGLLLDLHNLYCNSINLDLDAYAWLAEVDLNNVVEIHIAGGTMIGDIYADSHAGACPEEVWALLDHVMPHTPNLRGITFEFHDSYFTKLGDSGLAEQIARARAAWDRYA